MIVDSFLQIVFVGSTFGGAGRAGRNEVHALEAVFKGLFCPIYSRDLFLIFVKF